jgi:hypothetical protein
LSWRLAARLGSPAPLHQVRVLCACNNLNLFQTGVPGSVSAEATLLGAREVLAPELETCCSPRQPSSLATGACAFSVRSIFINVLIIGVIMLILRSTLLVLQRGSIKAQVPSWEPTSSTWDREVACYISDFEYSQDYCVFTDISKFKTHKTAEPLHFFSGDLSSISRGPLSSMTPTVATSLTHRFTQGAMARSTASSTARSSSPKPEALEEPSEHAPSHHAPSHEQTPSHHAPSQHAPSQHEPSQHEPSQHAPSQHAPLHEHASSQHEPSQDKPSQDAPSQHEPFQHAPSQHAPSQHEPSQHELAEHTPS